MRTRKHSLFASLISLLLCVSMLLGSTWAWFTDSVTSSANVISTGTLKVELWHTSNAHPAPTQVTEETRDLFAVELWEPGVATYENFTVKSVGSLWLQYKLGLNPVDVNYVTGDTQFRLSDALKAGVIPGGVKDADGDGTVTREEAVGQVTEWKAMNLVLEEGALAPSGKTGTVTGSTVTDTTEYGIVIWWEPTASDNNWNVNNGKTTSDGNPLTIDVGVTLAATQFTAEFDSFGPDYDTTAQFPKLELPVKVTVNVTNENDLTAQPVTMTTRDVKATVPAGVQLVPGTQALTLSVTELAQTGANVTTGATEDMVSMDVHIEGVADTNTAPIIVELGPVMPKYLNMGNYRLYHVEDGNTVPMSMVSSLAELDQHNEFVYDTNTGSLTVAMASFSEVALVVDTENTWQGARNYDWYDASKTEVAIANADQLAGLSAIVGGMDGQTQDSFAGKTVKLISDINIGDITDEDGRDVVFYPIGYYNSEGTYKKSNTAITSGFKIFEGTFDGQGHTIANFYQNTWEMKGDDEYYAAEEQKYRDGMGLFGKVYGGTVKNLNVRNFQSDGEYTTTGVIAAYADGATFENIAIFNCNPRVYNIGNGGIVGCVGWYAKDAGMKTTFKNITVDNSNKISALWGSWDVACGGIVGQYYPTSGQSSAGKPTNGGVHFDNCHISAQIDVYNDVCANYQYYAYRYAGMLIGSVRENVTVDGREYPKMDGITAIGSTVHFGTWNDYYYCELVDNTLASYTHDHQMSRLVEIKAIDGNTVTYLDNTTGTVPASGRANYVIVDYTKGHGDENATCYHFKDGKVWKHEDAGTETVDGVEGVLKEDKQHIYLEFNNLVTGYGWGVTSKGVDGMAGVTILDRAETNSAVKFRSVANVKTTYTTGAYISVGDLFEAVPGYASDIRPENVQVTVTPADENSTAGGIYTADTKHWKNGSLQLTGEGAAVVTISDYYFCQPTTLNVTITKDESVSVSEFEVDLGKVSGNIRLYSMQDTASATWSEASFITLAELVYEGQTIPAGSKIVVKQATDVTKIKLFDGHFYNIVSKDAVRTLNRLLFTSSNMYLGVHNYITNWNWDVNGDVMYAGDVHYKEDTFCHADNEVMVAKVSENVMVRGALNSLDALRDAASSGAWTIEADYWCDTENSNHQVIFIYVRSLKPAGSQPQYVPAKGEVICLPWGHGKQAEDKDVTLIRPRSASAVVLQNNVMGYDTLVQWVTVRFHNADATGLSNTQELEPGFYQAVYGSGDALPNSVITLKKVSTEVTLKTEEEFKALFTAKDGVAVEYLGGPTLTEEEANELGVSTTVLKTRADVLAAIKNGYTVKVSTWTRTKDDPGNAGLPTKLIMCGHSIVKNP